MKPVDLGEDPAAEQLFDEMMARLWAIGELTAMSRPAIATTSVRRAVAHGAATAVRELRQLPTAHVTRELCTLLWSCGVPPGSSDPWWCTPLGQLIRGGRQPRLARLDGTDVARPRDDESAVA